MQLLLVGNYGVGNLGDEVLRQYFLERFPDVAWVTVTASPQGKDDVPRLPGGMRSLLSLRWIRTLKALWSCDGVVFGGGSLFTDAESVRACVLWGIYVLAARLLRKPVSLAFQGIGPFRSRMGEWIARRVIASAAFVSVRDTASMRRVESWGLHKKIVQTSDPVILLLEGKRNVMDTKNVFTVIPRRNSSHSFRVRSQMLARSRPFGATVILSLQPDDPKERLVCENFLALLPGAVLQDVRSLAELSLAVAQSAFVFSERFHGALAALALGVPFEVVAQREGDKLSALGGGSATVGSLRSLALVGEQELRAVLRTVPKFQNQDPRKD